MKFIFPLTFSMAQVCWGGIEFFEGYKLANQTQYLDQMVRWGMDWLIKAHPNNDTLYVQVTYFPIVHIWWQSVSSPGKISTHTRNKDSPFALA